MGRVTTISFEKHLPRLFLEQLERYRESEPFTLRVPAAVMMSDISGFSALALELTRDGAHGVETLREILDDYFGSLGAIVARLGGDISTFAGDAVIAVWRADAGLEAATLQAAHCALTIQQEARGWSKRGNLTQRIAISCGEVLISKLGGSNGKWLNVFAGRPIVAAGRACDVTTPGEVLLTPDVWTLLRGDASGAVLEEGRARLDKLNTTPILSINGIPSATTLGPERLAAYVPDVLVRRSKSGHDEWLEEFRIVTVMFVKVENIDFEAADGHAALQAMTCAIQEAVHRYGGAMPYVQMDDKGLNFVIAFGIPTAAYEDDAARALTAGLDIQRTLRRIGVRPSIGLASGMLYCGECGAEQRRQYSMIGPAINFASRLAGAAPDDLLCDEETAKAAGDRLSFTIAHNVRPKHVDASVLALRPEWRERFSDGGPINALVGRANELQQLIDAVQRARTVNGARLLVTGEPGIGKSRVLRELRDVVEPSGIVVIAGAAQSIERGTPYFVWRDILRVLLAHLAEAGESPRATLHRQLHAEPHLQQWAALLNDILPLAMPETDLTREIRGAARASSIQALLLYVMKCVCAGAPALLILDDLHWIDALSGNALLMLMDRFPELSVVVGARLHDDDASAVVAEIGRIQGLETVALGALTEAQTRTMVARVYGITSVPEDLGQLIHGRSGGNPFYIEQLALELREAGYVEIVGGRCKVSDSIAARGRALPDNLRGVIASRVDRLHDDEQLILKVACVFGRFFSEAALAAVYPIARQGHRIAELLTGLSSSNLIHRETSDGPTTYAFTHVIVQETIYQLLPMAQRKRLHRRIADWLEAQHGGAMAGFYGVLANHCEAAEEFPRALNHLEGGAATAMRHSAYREAIANIETAQRLATEHALHADRLRRGHWQRLLGDSHHELSEYGLAQAHYLQALELLGRPYAPAPLSRIVGILARLVTQIAVRRAVSTDAGVVAEQSLASHAYARLAEIYYHENNPLAVLHLTLLSVDHAQRAGSIPDLCAGYGALAVAFGQAGLVGVARRYMRRAIELAETRPSDVNGIAYAHLLAMVYASSQCDWAVLDSSGVRAAALFADLGDGYRHASVQALQLVGDIQRGRYADATATLEQMATYVAANAVPRVTGWYFDNTLQRDIAKGCVARADIEARQEAAAKVDSLVDALTSCGNTASAWLCIGEPDRALASAEQGLAYLLGNAPVAGAGYIYGPIGVVEALLACWGRAAPEACREHAAKTARACRMLETYTRQVPSTRPRGYFLLACYQELKGARRKAMRTWRKAAEAAERLSMPYDRAAALQALGQRLPPGNGELKEALTIFETLDVPPPSLFEPTRAS